MKFKDLIQSFVCRNESGIKFRQLTDGKHFIQLIYDKNDKLRDCEYVNQRDQIRQFLNKFKYELDRLITTTSNFTLESLDNKTLPINLIKWFNYHELKIMCKRRHDELLKQAIEERSNKTLKYSER